MRAQLLAVMLEPAADVEDVRRRALRLALRSWRSTADPRHAKLPLRSRRQPGLTRAEVAELADLSLYWYTRLETAVDGHTCSPRAINRISDALGLEEIDRALLHTLANPAAFRSLRILLH